MSESRTSSDVTAVAARVRLAVFDFDGVMTDNRVVVMQDGSEAVTCWRSDGLGLRDLREAGVATAVLSTETNPVVATRCEKLHLECVQGLDDKQAALRELAEKHDVDLAETSYLGNDTNDAGCLEIAGLPACVADSDPRVIPLCTYVTQARGGFGAVREFCDLIVDAKRGQE